MACENYALEDLGSSRHGLHVISRVLNIVNYRADIDFPRLRTTSRDQAMVVSNIAAMPPQYRHQHHASPEVLRHVLANR